ncbi:MAG TPA: carboxypeptidase-like regulatory domain-containing protein [Chitinophagaceae bacterium]|jgi:hypothetical protein
MKQLISIILLTGLLAWHPVAPTASAFDNFVISGRVTSFEESLPLEGARVVVKGGPNATGTQADGTFSLLLAPADSVLLVSLSGYEPKEIKTSPKYKQYEIVLQRKNN